LPAGHRIAGPSRQRGQRAQQGVAQPKRAVRRARVVDAGEQSIERLQRRDQPLTRQLRRADAETEEQPRPETRPSPVILEVW